MPTGIESSVAISAPRVAPRSVPALLPVAQDLARRVLAVLAADATARMRAGTGEVQPVERQPVAGMAGQRAAQEPLVESVLSVHRVSAGQAVVPLEVERGQDLASRDQSGKAGC